MVGLPTDTWSLQNWSVEDYNALFEKVKSGEITIDDNAEMADPSTAGLEKIKFVK
jgi:basic membrane protein A